MHFAALEEKTKDMCGNYFSAFRFYSSVLGTVMDYLKNTVEGHGIESH